jgi:hypothetical protein
MMRRCVVCQRLFTAYRALYLQLGDNTACVDCSRRKAARAAWRCVERCDFVAAWQLFKLWFWFVRRDNG